ncbi:MAG: ADP-ribosylglycohydrolase family protein [Chromatiaceae bacterium]|nr:ADP-ribosylglycohydrolase family protein [Chromatiaceae bacterium]
MARLTSQTHPLRIDAVDTPCGGSVGMTICPGKQQKGSISGDWYRDLDTDLRVIVDWGAAAVVTLMEPNELAGVGVVHMGEAVEALGMDWYHLPIRDVQPPGQRFENRWVLAGLRLRRLLRRGHKVLIHCRGGLGRSGTVAARLLVELGVASQEAIAAVRSVRPGTIETRAQAQHVLACKEVTADEPFLDRALGCLLGGAIGDGFGYAVEFDSLGRIEQRFGAAGLRQPVLTKGQLRVSDDTQMTLFTLEGLTRGLAEARDATESDRLVEHIGKAYADWLQTQLGPVGDERLHGTLATRSALRHQRAPGNTCVSGLSAATQGTPQRPINDSKGCGGVMRVAPLGWLSDREPAACFDLAAQAAALTHGHPDGWLSAGMLAALIHALFAGRGFRRALDEAKTLTEARIRQHGVRADLLAVVARAETQASRLRDEPVRAIEALGGGWVGEEALAIALYAVLSADSFEEAVRRAANHSGDSDSTAAIAGQLWGAWKGIDSLPMAWIRRLDVLPECLHGVAELAAQGRVAEPTAAMRADTVPDPSLQACINILEMVNVLHRRGYQKLRIAPGMSPSGCYWRVAVAPSDNFLSDNGAMLRDFDDAAHHTTGNGAYPFQWRDAQEKGSEQLANLFLERHPQLARRGKGSDWAYAGWYLEVLGHAKRGGFPIAYWDGVPENTDSLRLVGPTLMRDQQMPAPPRVTALQPEAGDVPGECANPLINAAAVIDYDEVDLSQSSFFEQAERILALTAFYHQHEAALMPLTARVWDSLLEPKAPKVAFMAETLGIEGSDKIALRKVLMTYLRSTDLLIAALDDPLTDTAPDADLVAMEAYFERIGAIIEQQSERWARLLNVEPMDPLPEAAESAAVLHGPWVVGKAGSPDTIR